MLLQDYIGERRQFALFHLHWNPNDWSVVKKDGQSLLRIFNERLLTGMLQIFFKSYYAGSIGFERFVYIHDNVQVHIAYTIEQYFQEVDFQK